MVNVGEGFIPRSGLLHLLTGIEGIFGFGLLTANVSWLLSIYPVLEQRRSLAHRASLLHHAETTSGIRMLDLPEHELFAVLGELSTEVIRLRNSLAQFPVSYYFLSGEERSSLPGILEYLRAMAEAGSKSSSPAIRIAATELGGAIQNYLELVAEAFLQIPANDPPRVLRAYAESHKRELVTYHP
jgi:hypothetical protein